jgi:hypothetical protein
MATRRGDVVRTGDDPARNLDDIAGGSQRDMASGHGDAVTLRGDADDPL